MSGGAPATGLRARRESSRDSLLRANTAVAVVIITVLILAAAALWQSHRATRLQGTALLQQHRAMLAEDRARMDLWRALLAEATATRLGQSLDRRDAALEIIRRASALVPTAELRNEAIASLALPESRLEASLPLDASVKSYEFDHALRTCALGLTNGDVVLRRLSDGAELRRLKRSDGPVPDAQGSPVLMDFAPAADLLSVRYERGAFAVWEVAPGRMRFLRDADETRRPASRALFSSDAAHVIGPVFTPDGFAVMEAESGRTVAHFPQVGSFHHAAVRPAAHQFAAYTDGKVLLIDWDVGRVVDEFPYPAGARRLAWSPDGRLLAIGGSALNVHVWDIPSRTLREFPGHADTVIDLLVDPAGERLAVVSMDGSTRMWDLRDQRLLGVTGDRRLACWGAEGRSGWTVRRQWLEVRRDVPNPVHSGPAGTPGQSDGLTLDISPDGQWAVSKADPDGLLVWNLTDSRVPEFVPAPQVSSLCFHPRDPVLFLCGDRGLESRTCTVVTHEGRSRLQLGPAHRLPGVDPPTADLVTLSAEGSTRAHVALAAGAIWVERVGSDAGPVLMDDILHSSVARESGSPRGTGTLALSPDGRLLVVGADGHRGTVLFDARTGKPLRTVDEESGGVQFSSDGRWLVLASPRYCRLFRTSDWSLAWTRPADSRSPSFSGAAAFSGDASTLAVAASARVVDLLDCATGRELGRLESPSAAPINRIRWSADGRHLVLATRENTLDVWKPEVLQRELTALGLGGELPTVATVALSRPAPPAPPGFPGWIAPATLATAGAVAGIAFRSLRRHRRLIEEYSQADALAALREHELRMEREVGELKSRFVSMVSHEFRTPLGITMSAVELLRNYTDRLAPDRRAQLLEDIRSSTLRMAGLMEQVLLLGRVESGRLGFQASPLDLAGLLHRIADETLSATGYRCGIEVQADPGALAGARGDEPLLRHIVSNLLSNAVKYSAAGTPVILTATRGDAEAVLVIRDRGIGIPPDDQPRLFEAFHRGSNVGQTPGTGLGLLIVRRCVELHQGRIGFTSVEGQGTVFTVRLPLFGPVSEG